MSRSSKRPPQRKRPRASSQDAANTLHGDAVGRRSLPLGLIVILVAGCLIAATSAWVFYQRSRDLDSREEIPRQPPVKQDPGLNPQELPELKRAQEQMPTVTFTDITEQAGLDFRHDSGNSPLKRLPETMGGGCAFFDFDGDGDQDLLFVNSRSWNDLEPSSIPSTMQLYENDGTGKFTNVTSNSGLDIALFGMGVAIGDYDNDSLPDVFLSAVGENRLLHNEGRGQFRDVTSTSGVGGSDHDWSTSAGWFDYDRDGDLDLFVCNYLDWTPELDASRQMRLLNGERAFTRPQDFAGAFPYLYRNEGDGTFVDISQTSGIQVVDTQNQQPLAKALGVTFADFERDGWLDVVVANDTVRNQLLRNESGQVFTDVGRLAGIGVSSEGTAKGAMGVDIGQVNLAGEIGILIGNFSGEATSLFIKHPTELLFYDRADAYGIGYLTHPALTFGVFFFDYDLDGRLDILAANGHLERDIEQLVPNERYAQSPQLFWNYQHADDPPRFVEVPASKGGDDLFEKLVGRGMSYADIDQDGDLDVLLVGLGSRPRLLRNDQQLGHHWVRLVLTGSVSNRDAIGARIRATFDQRTVERVVMPTRSYLSQVELPITLGLGPATSLDQLEIWWPSGQYQKLENISVDQVIEIIEPTPERDGAGTSDIDSSAIDADRESS